MALPDNWSITDKGITPHNNAVYYALTPKSTPGSWKSHVFAVGETIYLPYLDQHNFSFNHNWNEADQQLKQVAASVLPSITAAISGASAFVSAVGGIAAGVGVHVSPASVYADSAPVTINVRTKLFSNKGDGSLLRFIDKVRADGFGTTSGAGTTVPGRIQLGRLRHPDYWKVQIISIAGGARTIVFEADWMLVVSTSMTMYAPFVSAGSAGKSEPMLVELEIAMKGAFRGLRESCRIGEG
jgi:hypothetical protein